MRETARKFVPLAATAALMATLGLATIAQAQSDKIRVGLMLPYTGTYAALGAAMENGFKLYVDEQGGRLSGREVEYFTVDDESDPAKGPENANRLVKRDRVDVLMGTVHSGVAMSMAKVAKDTNTLLIVANAGANALTGALCASNVFRSSFSNWQLAYAMGKVMGDRKHETAVTLTWKYLAGDESVSAFRQGFEENGGKVLKDLNVPFPNVEFQALLTEIAALKPDAVYAFFGGGGSVKLVRDYAAAGLKDRIPLYGVGFLTEGVLEAQGEAAEGVMTTLNYADGLDLPKDKAFREKYVQAYKIQPDVYAVQGYDAAQMLAAGLEHAGGDISKLDQVIEGIRQARIDSPRGEFTISKAHNPVQNIYLREVSGNANRYVSVAIPALEDPGLGCRM